MKHFTKFSIVKHVLFLKVFVVFATLQTFAQEKKLDVDINTGSASNNGFFGNPWVWIVGAAVFILLLVALLRGGRKSG